MKKNPHTLLHVICDYVSGGMEFGEIDTQIIHHLENPEDVTIHDTSVPSLETLPIGFVSAQYGLANFNKRMVIYGNAAPRRSKDSAMKNNIDNGIKYAKLKNGVEIINVYSEFAFGFVKDEIVDFREIDCPNEGSQFRSRDFFPERVAKIVNGDYSILGKKLNVKDIPEIPNNLVAWTDGFGNIKTTMRETDLKARGFKSGETVIIRLNGVTMVGVIAVGGFSVDRGVLAVNIGSSGFENSFVELFLRVHHISEKTAAVRFDYPVSGTEFEIEKI